MRSTITIFLAMLALAVPTTAMEGRAEAAKAPETKPTTATVGAAREVSRGFRPPPPEVMRRRIMSQDARAARIARAAAWGGSAIARPAAAPDSVSLVTVPAAFDWSDPGRPGGSVVTAVQDQDGCGCCYDFAANAAFEASYVIRRKARPEDVGASEQCLLDCQTGEDEVDCCDGGWWDQPFNLMIKRGVPKRTDYTYIFDHATGQGAVKRPCRLDGPNAPAVAYTAANWGFVDRDNQTFMPTDDTMKHAILDHGPIAVYASDKFVQWGWDHHQEGEVYLENTDQPINHAVAIVGWDDDKEGKGKGAWRIKNSWGTDWGQKGFAWVGFGVNKIGFNAAWVEATAPTDPLLMMNEYLLAKERHEEDRQ